MLVIVVFFALHLRLLGRVALSHLLHLLMVLVDGRVFATAFIVLVVLL